MPPTQIVHSHVVAMRHIGTTKMMLHVLNVMKLARHVLVGILRIAPNVNLATLNKLGRILV